MMQIRQLHAAADVVRCIKLYLASPYGHDLSSTIDERICYNNLVLYSNKPNSYLYGAFRGEMLVAFLLSIRGVSNLHSSEIALNQEYYVSSDSGFAAARTLVTMHDALESLGRKLGVAVVKSHCSHLDTKQTLCRIMEKHGWQRSGYIVFKRLKGKLC